MPRKPNDLETVHLRISTTPQVQQQLQRLVETGLYGKNPTDAAERLIARRLEDLVTSGFFEKFEGQRR